MPPGTSGTIGRVPELPEVETTRRLIEPHLVGRRIARVETTKPSYFFITPPARLRRVLPGRSTEALERRGKYLIAGLDDGSRLLLHLGNHAFHDRHVIHQDQSFLRQVIQQAGNLRM